MKFKSLKASKSPTWVMFDQVHTVNPKQQYGGKSMNTVYAADLSMFMPSHRRIVPQPIYHSKPIFLPPNDHLHLQWP
jgi:hypothetical protein